MNLRIKRILAAVSAAVIVVVALTGTITTSAVDIVYSGQCGDAVNWTLDSDGVLKIFGEGSMYQDYYVGHTSWTYSNYSNQVREVVFEDGVTDIGSCAFGSAFSSQNMYPNLTKITLPTTIKKIGNHAFACLNIEEISLPDSLIEIGEGAFNYSKITSIILHEGMTIGGCAFQNCKSLKEVIIGKNITFNLTMIGVMGMGRSNAAFSYCTGLEKVTIEDGVTDLNVEMLFNNCKSLNDIYLYSADLKSVVTGNDVDTFPNNDNLTFYIYMDSTTETTLKNAGYLTNSNTVYLATKDAIDKLDNAIKSFDDNVDTSKYTEDYAKDFNDALENGKDILNKFNLDNYSGITLNEVNDVLNVLNNIKYKPADYTAVDAAIEKVPADLSKYTEESVKKLQDALDAVNRNLDINSQETVDNYVKAIQDAIKGLVQKTPAPTKSPSVRPTANAPIVTTRSASEVAKDKAAAEKIVKQAKITKLKVKSKAKKITVTWKKVKKAVGYEVQVSKKKNFKKNIFDKFTSKKKISFKKKLKSGKTYYIRVRAYATYKDKNGVECKVYSKWNKKLRKVKVK